MLKGIKDILKAMGEALAFAYVGEMLTDDQKAEALSRHKAVRPTTPKAASPGMVLARDEEFSPESV